MLSVTETEGRTTRRESHVASYRKLGRTLLDLQLAADQVFDAISRKTADERDKLSQISRRIQAAKAKIDTISHSEEEITIASPTKHPFANSRTGDFKPLFQDLGFPIAKLSINGGLNREYGRDETLELYKFFSEENSGYALKESDLAKHKDNTSLEKLFHNASLSSASNNNTSSYKYELKEEELPPPPPSLSSTNFTV